MTAHEGPNPVPESVPWRQFWGRMIVLSLLFPLVLFLCAGRLDWGMGWLYVGLAVSITVISRVWMLRRNPGLFAERTTALERENTKGWDRYLVPFISLAPLLTAGVAGLDMRFGWSPPFAGWVQIGGVVVLVGGYGLATWAMLVNAYYSSMVRIQTDRGQHVITSGPYRIVRHPSYLGFLLGGLGTALMLSSLWALVPAGLLIAALVIRTRLEDRTLQVELPGYADYAQQTRFRLIPGVW